MAALNDSLSTLWKELVDGPPDEFCYLLNRGDRGLVGSLDRLSAEAASRPNPGGASIAAHVDHVSYGLGLMLRWSEGEPNPWADADWTASWRRGTVTDAEWDALRERLREQAARWGEVISKPRALSEIELSGVMASVAHAAYHLGAIRQIDRSLQGPKAEAVQ
jgi:hypothetical protein